MRTTTRPSRSHQEAICAWCDKRFCNVFDFLDHVEGVHIDPKVAQHLSGGGIDVVILPAQSNGQSYDGPTE